MFYAIKSNAISIAVDDLMVYREYFNSLNVFAFSSTRSLATQESKLALNDELDHLGNILNYNCYCFLNRYYSHGICWEFLLGIVKI